MTALADRRITSQATQYQVQYPETGEVLGYVTLTPGDPASPLEEALEEHGFRLVAVATSSAWPAGLVLTR